MFKEIYSIPKFKELDKISKAIFILSFCIPIFTIYIFLHAYFLPFGYNKDVNTDSRAISYTNSQYFYTNDDEERVLDGIAVISVEPRIPKRNIITTVSIDSNNAYIIPPRVASKDINFEPVFEIEPSTETYTLLDYKVEEKDLISFKLELDMDPWNEKKYCQTELILKYRNVSVTRFCNHIEARFKGIVNDEISTLYMEGYINPDEFEEDIIVYVNYKPLTDTNGFLELFVNNRFAGRGIIEDKINPFFDRETIFHEELLKDFSQEDISLYQEQYTMGLVSSVPEEFKRFIDYKTYYDRLFKPDIEYDEDEEDKEIQEYYFEFNEERQRIQTFYDKEFYKHFSDEIKKLSITYEYPFEKLKENTTLYPITPFEIFIAGEDAKIKDININLFREPVWNKLDNL